MKKILIIYPHFPPSNLAGVHRPRLFAQHLPAFGWEPVILTVDEKYYEEELDPELLKLIPPALRIEKVKANRRIGPIGDIGLRAFFQLYKKAKQLIRKEQFDFLYIPVPSFYCALLGRMLHRSAGIKYGIDYIDPWVHVFPGSNRLFSRHWFSTKLAKILEPIAVKKASLITGVAEGYYLPVLERNPELTKKVLTGAMPYGAEEEDHRVVSLGNNKPRLFQKKENKIQFVYAGAMLPKAYQPLEAIMEIIAADKEEFKNAEFHFIGTGKTANDPEGFNIKPYAEKYGVWNSIIFEYPKRIPYLDVLMHLDGADAVFVLGSTEPHYTPSKVFQAILSGKPLLAVLHEASTAVEVIRASNAGIVLSFNGEKDINALKEQFAGKYRSFIKFAETFDRNNVDRKMFEQYSAFAVTKKLAELLEKLF